MKKQVQGYTKQVIFAEVAEGLAATQVERFETLAEGVEYIDEETYKRKLEIVKENYFTSNKRAGSDIVENEVDTAEDPEAEKKVGSSDPVVARYMQAISRTAKK